MAKNLIVTFSLLLFGTVNGQEVQGTTHDTLYTLLNLKDTVNRALGKLPVHEVNPCLYPILRGIIKNDTKCEYFIRDKTGYVFSVEKKVDSTYNIAIYPTHLNKINLDANGIFEFGNRKFICLGDIPKELFTGKINDSIILRRYVKKNEITPYFDIPERVVPLECKSIKLYFIISACNYPRKSNKQEKRYQSKKSNNKAP